jgi:2-iminobutanoate/2-iminopropanoate deaminase
MTDKKIIATENAPKAIGPYSIGVVVGDFLFTAGQIGLDPRTGEIVPGGVAAETRRALLNLQAVIEAGGAELENVVKTTVYLRDMNDFAEMNRVYGEFFVKNPPARTTVQVAALPKSAAVEIEAIAIVGD